MFGGWSQPRDSGTVVNMTDSDRQEAIPAEICES